MGLSRGRMRKLWLHQPKAQRIADGMEPAFETESVALLGTIQPLEGTTTARLYGEESAEMSLLLTEEKTELKEGVGIALAAAGECRFRIAAPPERWKTHQRAVLKSI